MEETTDKLSKRFIVSVRCDCDTRIVYRVPVSVCVCVCERGRHSQDGIRDTLSTWPPRDSLIMSNSLALQWILFCTLLDPNSLLLKLCTYRTMIILVFICISKLEKTRFTLPHSSLLLFLRTRIKLTIYNWQPIKYYDINHPRDYKVNSHFKLISNTRISKFFSIVIAEVF